MEGFCDVLRNEYCNSWRDNSAPNKQVGGNISRKKLGPLAMDALLLKYLRLPPPILEACRQCQWGLQQQKGGVKRLKVWPWHYDLDQYLTIVPIKPHLPPVKVGSTRQHQRWWRSILLPRAYQRPQLTVLPLFQVSNGPVRSERLRASRSEQIWPTGHHHHHAPPAAPQFPHFLKGI